MRKITAMLLLLTCSLTGYAQLTEGEYSIHGVRCLIKGQTSYTNIFDYGSAVAHVKGNSIFIVISGYFALSYFMEKPQLINESYVYSATELQSGKRTTIIFNKPQNEESKDGGLLLIKRSEDYTDIFSITKK